MSMSRRIRGALALLLCLPVVVAAATKSPPAPEPVTAGSMIQVVLSLLLVLLLIGGMAWGLRRFSHLPGTGGGAMKILGGLSLGQRERIVLVQVGEQQLLLGIAPGSVRTLHVLEEPVIEPAKPSSGGESFAERLGQALRRGQKG